MREQASALADLARARDLRLRHVKLHGALYHMAGRDEALAEEAVSAVQTLDRDLTLVVPPGSTLERVARASGLAVAGEGFPERAYLGDGSLAPRDLPGALIHDPATAARRAVEMARDGRTTALDGSTIPLEVETLCVHGDAPGAAAAARAIRLALDQASVRVAPL